MTAIETLKQNCSEVLSLLNLNFDELEREGIKSYLHLQLRERKIELFKIAQKHGIKTADDLEYLFKKGKIEEKEGWEDYFKLDHIEAEIETIEKALETL